MPRPINERIEPTRVQNPVNSNERLQVTARPVDMTLAPRVDNELLGLAQGLSAFAPALAQYGQVVQKQEAFGEKQRGKLAAEQGQFSTYDEGYKALSAQSSPWYQQAYMEEVGRRSAQDYHRKLSTHLTENLDPNDPDPVKAAALTKQFYAQETRGLQDPAFLSGFNESSQATNAQALDAVTQAHSKVLRERTVDLLRGTAADYLDTPDRPTRWLDELKDKGVRLNIPRAEVERDAFEQTMERAISQGNPRLLEVFDYGTSDGQSSFAIREPQKYGGALRAAERAAATRLTGNLEMLQFKALTGLNTKIEDAKAWASPLDIPAIQDELYGLVDSGVFKAEAASGLYTKALSADRDYRRAYANAGVWRGGGIGAGTGITSDGTQGPITGQDAIQAATIGGRQIADEVMKDATIPEAAKPAVILSNTIDASLRNRMIFPDHLATIKLAANAAPEPDAKGVLKMPESFGPAAALAYAYWQKDPALFNSAMGGDKHAADVYDQYFTNLERDPNKNPELAYRTTMATFGPGAIPGKEVTVDGTILKGVLQDAGSAIRSQLNRGFFEFGFMGGRHENAPKFASDVYLQGFLKNDVATMFKANPSMNPDALAATAAKRFANQHMLVNGQWLSTAAMPGGLSKQQAAHLEDSLNAYKVVAAREAQLNMTTEEAQASNITLSPTPVSIDPALGPQHAVFIDGHLTAVRVNPEILMQQYVSGRFVPQEAITNARALTAAVDSYAEVPLAMTDKVYAETLDALKFNQANGFMTNDAISASRKKLDQAHDQYKTQSDVVQRIAHAQQQRNAIPAVRALTEGFRPFDATDLADIKAPGKYTANVPATIATIKQAAKDGHEAASAQASIAGFGVTRYASGGDAKVGFGYSLMQDDAVVRGDLIEGLRTNSLQAPRILEALRKGTYKLNYYEARQLFTTQNRRVSRDLQQKMGAGAWTLLPKNKQDALAVAAINTKAGKWDETYAAMQAGNWDAVRNNLAVDPSHARAATGMLRLLMSGHKTFSAVTLNNF